MLSTPRRWQIVSLSLFLQHFQTFLNSRVMPKLVFFRLTGLLAIDVLPQSVNFECFFHAIHQLDIASLQADVGSFAGDMWGEVYSSKYSYVFFFHAMHHHLNFWTSRLGYSYQLPSQILLQCHMSSGNAMLCWKKQ